MPSLPSERERAAREDFLANAETASRFVAGMTFETVTADMRTNQARHPHIPWRDMADAGDFYRHGYRRVALDIVWKTVQDQLPEIVAVCRAELDTPSAS